jgi:AcrR family transcriptional regulator
MEARGRLLAAARPLFEAGERPSVDELARAAGVSRATFYRHFQGRSDLVRALDLEPDPSSRDRVLETAIEMVGRQGLAGLSMDELALRSGVSRASLYRLFPGKPALFRELVRAFSPMEAVVEVVARLGDRPPEEVMPALARAVAASLRDRVGILRAILLEVTGRGPDTAEGVELFFSQAVSAIVGYAAAQMAAGRLRPMHPVLAVQGFAGPLVMHLLTRELAEERLGLGVDVEEAAGQLAAAWVRGMRPEGAEEVAS